MPHIDDAIRNSGLPMAVVFLFAFTNAAYGQTPEYGKLRGAIRDADYSCAHVQKVSDAGNEAWNVQFNSGFFVVTRIDDGQFSVIKKAPSG